MTAKPGDPKAAQVRRAGWWLFAALLLIYNANGREMSTYDSQPTKYAARELALHGRLTLDAVVAAAPGFAERSAFQRDRDGHYRSAYSVVPAVLAAIPAALLHATRLVDLRAPLAPALIAAITASLLTAAAVALVFASLARAATMGTALVIAIGLGLGTNLWPLASRTLWQLETVSFGLALGLYGWLRSREELRAGPLLAGAIGLALAGAARPQIAPMIAVLVAGQIVRLGARRMAAPIALIGLAAAVLVAFQWHWFGDVLGATNALQAQNLAAHGVTSTISATPWIGAAGLLISPNRGLLIFSPVVIFAFVGFIRMQRRPELAPRGERWWGAAALVQLAGYACYSMWWGGHTYGPRYLVDILVPLAAVSAPAVEWARGRSWARAAGFAALSASIVIAATGAFCYPNDQWNGDPDVDTHHERLWDWRDLQIVRCWTAGPSPQNFSLFDTASIRQNR